MPTISEALFDRYCARRGYASVPVEAGSSFGKTPDRLVTTPAGRAVVEIKELTANDEEVIQARALTAGRMVCRGDEPGERVSRLIKEAAPQLKRLATSDAPGMVVLYDNLVIDGVRPWESSVHLSAEFIAFGMYGFQPAMFSVECSGDKLLTSYAGIGRSSRHRLTPGRRTYVSAVAVLRQYPATMEPYLYTYHNYFTKWVLPHEAFRGGMDRHFRKLSPPSASSRAWERIP